jgi:RNA polymerase sigma factor (sigma-70 family)
VKTKTDEQLISACLDGQQGAWAALIDRYRRLVYSIPLRYGLSADDAGDIFQMVCLELYTNLATLREPGALRGWLTTVSVHQSLRWKTRSRGHATCIAQAGTPELSCDPALAEMLERAERERVLHRAIARLPARCRNVVRLLFLADPPVPYAELAQRFGLAIGSIGFIRGRCLRVLRRKLDELGFR